ncbi:hypothetical protein P6U16_14225 [Rhizobium sp. 32-5/1]|uniref:hypothetical protein n=1 Tax=Rhizobium sp. 32-5/1 TaxID=3019602 RepID=UPI00240DDF10|nr:hypothetical protein [Rhizobium sp. 32-5/1]WEZ82306.1 hypothetical protein P6U16_14225 [Rhizobium sp. 32-5/1]
MGADLNNVMALREEAGKLALKLNNGEPGILAGPDAPGCMLASLTAAPDGTVPLWGQTGSFIVNVKSMRVRINMGPLRHQCTLYAVDEFQRPCR